MICTAASRHLCLMQTPPLVNCPDDSPPWKHGPGGHTAGGGSLVRRREVLCSFEHPQLLAGLCRRNGRQSWRWVRDLSTTSSREARPATSSLRLGAGDIPTQHLVVGAVAQGADESALTNVLEPSVLSVPDALSVYPWRWKVERLFFDLKEVLNLHRFYTSSPNGGLCRSMRLSWYMQFRVAQAMWPRPSR